MENHRKRDNLEDTVVVGRIILKYSKMGLEVLEWIEVALGMGHVAVVMNTTTHI